MSEKHFAYKITYKIICYKTSILQKPVIHFLRTYFCFHFVLYNLTSCYNVWKKYFPDTLCMYLQVDIILSSYC